MLCFVPAQGMSVGWLKDVSEGAGGGGTEFHMLPLADERRTEERWAAKRRRVRERGTKEIIIR